VVAFNRAGPKVGQDLSRVIGLDRDLGGTGSIFTFAAAIAARWSSRRVISSGSLTMLYRSTHCLCRTGASMQYLSRSSSPFSWL
jgi:hypothetical protein